MKNSKNFKKILSTSLASLTALSTLSGSISTKIYAEDSKIQVVESTSSTSFSHNGYNITIFFNPGKEVEEKFAETFCAVMENDTVEYKEQGKEIVLETKRINSEKIKEICSLEDPAKQKEIIEGMLAAIEEEFEKAQASAGEAAKENESVTSGPTEQTEKETPAEETQTKASVKETKEETPTAENTQEAKEKENTEISKKIESEETSDGGASVADDLIEQTNPEAPTAEDAQGAQEVEHVTNDSNEQTEKTEEAKEESTTPAKEKKSLLSKIVDFLKNLPLIGKLFKFLFNK